MRFTKETFRRAMRTFLQAAVSYVLVNITVVDFTSSQQVIEHALLGLGVSALAAGIAAVMNAEFVEDDDGE